MQQTCEAGGFPSCFAWGALILVPRSLSSLHSQCSIFRILLSRTLHFFVIHIRPCALPPPPGLCFLLSRCSVPFPPSRADPFSTLPQECSPHTHTPGLHRHSQIVLFLSVYVSVLPTRPWILWVLGLCLTSESPLTPYLAQGEQRVTVDDSIWEGITFSPLSTPPCL